MSESDILGYFATGCGNSMDAHPRKKPNILDSYKDEIRQLYLDQNMRLQDVMKTMEQRGVKATQKVYKTKIFQWKFFKYNRKEDIAAILKQQRQRASMGKETIPLRNGKPFDLSRYLSRKGVDVKVEYIMKTSGFTELPAHMKCVTPPPSSEFVQSPGALGVKEILASWFSQGMERRKVEDQPLFSNLQRYRGGEAFHAIGLYCDALWLLSMNYSQKGWDRAHAAFGQLHTVLFNWNHYSILILLAITLRRPDAGIHGVLWKYLASQARIRLGGDHPTYRVLAPLARLFGEEKEGDRNAFIQSCLAAIMTATGQEAIDTEWLKLRDPTTYKHGCHNHLERWNPSEIPDHKLSIMTSDVQYFRAVIFGFCSQTNWQDEHTSREAFQKLAITKDGRQSVRLHLLGWHCLYSVARYHRAQCNREPAATSSRHKLARYYLHMAVDLDENYLDPTKDYLECLLLLEEWCEEAGDEELLRITQEKKHRCLEVLFSIIHHMNT